MLEEDALHNMQSRPSWRILFGALPHRHQGGRGRTHTAVIDRVQSSLAVQADGLRGFHHDHRRFKVSGVAQTRQGKPVGRGAHDFKPGGTVSQCWTRILLTYRPLYSYFHLRSRGIDGLLSQNNQEMITLEPPTAYATARTSKSE